MNRRTAPDRFARSEPFEVFTRPQRSRPARLLGLALRRRAEIAVIGVLWLVWSWLADGVDAWTPDPVPPADVPAGPADSLAADPVPAWVAGILLVVLACVFLAVPLTRRYLHRRALAVLTRHRLRSVFVQRRVMNWTGNLPVLLWSRPTPVGERVWVLLRAGIDGTDIERNLAHIASGCFARDARINITRRMTALVLVDVIRRDPLSGPAAQPAAHTPRPAARPVLRSVPTQKGA